MAQIAISVTTAPSFLGTQIPVHLKVHAEAHGLEEEWSGKSNFKTRRKLQNRLNQRAYRRRKAEEKANNVQLFDIKQHEQSASPMSSESDWSKDQTEGTTQPSSVGGDFEPMLPSNELQLYKDDYSLSDLHPSRTPSPFKAASWCRDFERFQYNETLLKQTDPVRYNAVTGKLVTETSLFEQGYLRHLPPKDLYRMPADDALLSLMYYNVFRALVANVQLLGLDTILMHTDEYPSPFIRGTSNFKENRTLPPWMQPTLLQRTQPHHPCFDIFPDPAVRDNAIRNSHCLPHGTLCMTLAGRNTWNENERDRRSGMVIWGSPEDAGSWEVTEGFVRSWGWLVVGSVGLEVSTNRWRKVRGEKPIYFARGERG